MNTHTHVNTYRYVAPFYSVKVQWIYNERRKTRIHQEDSDQNERIESNFYQDALIANLNV